MTARLLKARKLRRFYQVIDHAVMQRRLNRYPIGGGGNHNDINIARIGA